MMARQISARLLEEKRKASEIDEESNVNLFNKLGVCTQYRVNIDRYYFLNYFAGLPGFSGHQP